MENTITDIKDYFKDLIFNEEKHIYTVEGKQLPSVSKLIEKFTIKFDEYTVSLEVAERTGASQAEVLAEWEATRVEACDRGHRVHLFGELYPFNKTLKPKCKQEEAVVKFWDSLPEHIVPVFVEIRMYHKLLNFAGTSDILLYDTIKETFIIADYKTNKDLFKNFKKKTLVYPFTHLLDSPFNKYQIQLSFYQILFEQTGHKVSSRKIVWLLKTGDFLLYDTEDLTKPLTKYLSQLN